MWVLPIVVGGAYFDSATHLAALHVAVCVVVAALSALKSSSHQRLQVSGYLAAHRSLRGPSQAPIVAVMVGNGVLLALFGLQDSFPSVDADALLLGLRILVAAETAVVLGATAKYCAMVTRFNRDRAPPEARRFLPPVHGRGGPHGLDDDGQQGSFNESVGSEYNAASHPVRPGCPPPHRAVRCGDR